LNSRRLEPPIGQRRRLQPRPDFDCDRSLEAATLNALKTLSIGRKFQPLPILVMENGSHPLVTGSDGRHRAFRRHARACSISMLLRAARYNTRSLQLGGF